MIDEVLGPPRSRPSLTRLPHLLAGSFKLVFGAARRDVVVSAVLQLVSGAGIAIELLLARQILSLVLTSARASFVTLLPLVLLLGFLIAVISFASSMQWELQRIISELVSHQTSARVLDVAVAAPLEAYESPDFHDRLQRAEMGAGLRPWQITQSLLGMAGSGVGVIAIGVALFVLQPLLIPLLVLALVPMWFVAARSSSDFYRYSFGMTPNDRKRDYLRRTLTSRDAAKEIIAFQLGPFLRGLWERLYAERIIELRELIRKHLIRQGLASLATSLLIAVPLLLLTFLVVRGFMSLPQALAAAAGLVLLRPMLGGLVFSGLQLYESALFLDDYEAFLALEPALDAVRPRAPAPSAFDSLRMEGVSFTYPTGSKPALTGVNLEIKKGEVVALVGENGSGKTTLAKLLCGLYTPQSGRICWDGMDIASVDHPELRKAIAVIFQDYIRYQLPAWQNIAVGRHHRFDDRDGVRRAAVDAGADPFLKDLPAGYDTLLGPEFEGGKELSSGQWQRVALARAFFRDAPFLILDEPTAALDARAEHELFESIRSLTRGRSVLLISHRFSTVRSADRIYVLKEGMVVEQGTHDQLMANEGLYHNLFTLQASPYWGRQNNDA
jgi:ATP-binding cassette subfamily B protein